LLAEAKTMPQVITFARETSIGPRARNIRMALRLTQRELADIAGVSQEDVDLFERNMPVPLQAKRKLVKELWAAREAG